MNTALFIITVFVSTMHGGEGLITEVVGVSTYEECAVLASAKARHIHETVEDVVYTIHACVQENENE